MRPYLIFVTFLFLAGCGVEPADKSVSAPVTPIGVDTAVVADADWQSTYEATGTVRARTTAVVASKLMAYTREVRAQIGDHVREGQPLAVLDARDLESSVARTEAGREEMKSAIAEAESAAALARSQLDLALVTFRRVQDLLDKRSIAAQEYDEAAARLKTAQAALDMALARRSQMNAKMSQIEQEIRGAGILRGYSVIVAPFAGTIVAKSIDPGTLAVPGTPLFTMERDGAFRLEVSVPESRLSTVRVGKIVSVQMDAMDRAFPARIAEVVPSVDAAARAGTVKIDLPPIAELRSGVFGRALIDIGVRKVLTVPIAGVLERGQLQSVYVAENNVAHTRLVTIGTRMNDRVEVLSGLNPGERVIAPVPASLADGALIGVRQ